MTNVYVLQACTPPTTEQLRVQQPRKAFIPSMALGQQAIVLQ
jgi:hypothetical protein